MEMVCWHENRYDVIRALKVCLHYETSFFGIFHRFTNTIANTIGTQNPFEPPQVNLSCRYHLYIAKYLSSIRDEWVKNLGNITVLACEM